jgi:hypothetical protein
MKLKRITTNKYGYLTNACWDGQEYTGDIEKYAWNVAQCEVGIAQAGENW